ncbi:MAG TPA: sigma-70 family RNA polymerase sigma factor, partial [Tepidisphaeraceae bacterium]
EATLRKHDTEHPDHAVLPTAAPALSAADLDCLSEYLAAGDALAVAARRIGRRAPAVYRLRLTERLERLTRRSMRFIDDPLYHVPDAGQRLVELLQADIAAEPPREMSRVPADLPPYLRDLYRTPLLSPARERALFLKFNFEKFEFVTARRRLDPALARVRDVVALERLLARLQATKNGIIQANLRLVVSVAKKHARPGAELMELVSEGNLTLMRAVESFDTRKGNKFSTYATLALMKGYARTVSQMVSAAALPDDVMDQLAQRRRASRQADDALATREHVDCLLARLDDRERRVICDRYDIASDAPVADFAGASQTAPAAAKLIERAAIEKLRGLQET